MKTRIAVIAAGLFVVGIIVFASNAQNFTVSNENASLTADAAKPCQAASTGQCQAGEQKKEGCQKSAECNKEKEEGSCPNKSNGCKKQEGSDGSGCPKSSS